MVGYFKNAPKEDEVLLTGIDGVREVIKPLVKYYVLDYIHNLSQLDTEMKRVEDGYLANILTKAREAVGGVRSPYFHTTHMNQTYPCKACVFDEAIQAILKALGGE